MPIYEYKCEDCGKVTEIWHGVNEPLKTSCPHCGGRLHKMISQTSFILKGSGWYATDYKRSSGNGSDNGPKKPGRKKKEKQASEASSDSAASEASKSG